MNINIKFVVFILLTAIVSSTVLLIPFLAELELTGVAIITLVSTITLLGAVWYFLSNLKSFKSGLKIAYYLLATGIVLYSFVLLQFFLVLFAGVEDVMLRNMLFLVPYGLASFFAYLGMRKFARLLDVKNVWTSFLFTVIIAVVAGIAATQFPVPPSLLEYGIDTMTLDLVSGVLTWSVVFGIGAAIVALYVRQTISKTYKPAMTWVAIALFLLAVSALHEFIVKIYFFDSNYVLSDFSSWPFLLTGALFLRSGLAFRGTQHSILQLSPNASYVDVVAATASLVSKPAAVDSELDKLRNITASTPNLKALSKEDKTTLKQVYLYLEEYLVTREPLAKFSREALRENLPKDFAASLGKQISSDVFRAQSASTTAKT